MKMVYIVLVYFFLSVVSLFSQTNEPKELIVLRDSFQKEMDRVTLPILDKYVENLERMKRQYGAKGDSTSMLLVQKEIYYILSMNPVSKSTTPFFGVWKIKYNNGYTRFFSFKKDSVSFEWSGVKHDCTVKLLENGLYLFDFSDGTMETWEKRENKTYFSRLYKAKDYPNGVPDVTGIATPK